jgi:hypothetical protein
MIKKPIPDQIRRRRGAATELRSCARQLLEVAQMLDNYPAMRPCAATSRVSPPTWASPPTTSSSP